METIPNNGLIRYYMVGNLERVLVTNPSALREVLVQKAYDFDKSDLARVQLSRVTGTGLLLAEGDEHKAQRKNLLPAFSYRHVKDLYPIFWSKGVEMVTMIEKHIQSKSGDNLVIMGDWASRATLDIVGVAGMDQDFHSLRDPSNKLNEQYRRILIEPSLLMRYVTLLGLFIMDLRLIVKLPLKRNIEIKAASEYIRTVARQIIRQKKEKMEKQKDAASDVDIISVALRSGAFSEENLVDQMMTFLAAGHETTSSALQWAIYALCKHPEMQTRLREEVRANLPPISVQDRTPASASAVDSLPYLNAFCHEVLRYYPPVPITVREASRDTTIVGSPIPKGTIILLAPEAINRSTQFWGPDANEFNPERWMGPGRANTGGADSNYAFMSFIHGPRSCIGQGFAKGELACLVAVTVGKFHMELENPDAELLLKRGVTVSPKDGVRAKFTALEGW
ncbi:hypothetical protein VTN00DRAFT_4879 [Thermoascus crustaceus]|uniref:uncharacterized protein n=1 Tax=Thermoascus crustaceus TaxID=5088 RepID=UPI0037444FDB